MTCRSKATIYLLDLTVQVKKKQHFKTFKSWAVSCFTDPLDIMKYDSKTVTRLMIEGYGKSKVKQRLLNIKSVTVVKELGKSQQTLDDKKRPDSSSD
jgi:hypothetical protein